MHTSSNHELPKITEAVQVIVRSLAPHYVWELVRLLGDEHEATVESRRSIGAKFPNDAAREQVERFFNAVGAVAATDLSLALACAVSVADSIRREQSIEIVWTGPATPTVSVRRSAAVLLELVDQTKHEIVLLSYAAFKIPDLLAALQRACQRDVAVHLLLESDEDSGGRLSVSGAGAFDRLRGSAKFYVWPGDRRPLGAVMHAKCVVADGESALITSANLTAHAIDINMELGLLIRGGEIPRRLRIHLHDLIEQGVFCQVGPI